MLIVSYDISDDKLRRRFSKMLTKNGAIRLQYSVYELNHSSRLLDVVKEKIKGYFAKQFSFDDSVLIFSADMKSVVKYGNAIHRDQEIVFL